MESNLIQFWCQQQNKLLQYSKEAQMLYTTARQRSLSKSKFKSVKDNKSKYESAIYLSHRIRQSLLSSQNENPEKLLTSRYQSQRCETIRDENTKQKEKIKNILNQPVFNPHQKGSEVNYSPRYLNRQLEQNGYSKQSKQSYYDKLANLIKINGKELAKNRKKKIQEVSSKNLKAWQESNIHLKTNFQFYSLEERNKTIQNDNDNYERDGGKYEKFRTKTAIQTNYDEIENQSMLYSHRQQPRIQVKKSNQVITVKKKMSRKLIFPKSAMYMSMYLRINETGKPQRGPRLTTNNGILDIKKIMKQEKNASQFTSLDQINLQIRRGIKSSHKGIQNRTKAKQHNKGKLRYNINEIISKRRSELSIDCKRATIKIDPW